MFKHRFHENVGRVTHFHWFLLSFLAGTINAGGFMAATRFVSHVTGYATLAGMEFAKGKWGEAFALLSIPGYFLVGVMVAAHMIESRGERERLSSYATVMAMVSVCVGLVTLGGILNWFGGFGSQSPLRQDYVLLSLLCGASGLQNGAITMSSGGTIRVTHLTGMTTDVGLGIVKIFHSIDEHAKMKEIAANTRRFLSIASFIAGSAAAAVLFYKYRYRAFLLPTLVAGYATWVAYMESKQAQPQPVEEEKHFSRRKRAS